MSYLLALDQGTTSSRALVFREEGTLVGLHQEPLDVATPRPGWVEQDAGAIFDTQSRCIERVLADNSLRAKDIAALGIANQRETTIVWDRKTGEPIGPAIVWQDRRTAEACRRLRESGAEDKVKARTGLLLDPYFCATKIAWLLDEVPGARKRAEAGELAFGTVDTWLLWRLSGGRTHATDISNASRTLLYDIHRQRWDADLLALFGVPASLLPEVHVNTADFGKAVIGGARFTVHGMGGDQQSALFAQGCLEPGHAKVTYGTGAFVLANTGEASYGEGLLTTVAWQLGKASPVYALEGSIFNAGAVVQWLREGLGIIEQSEDVERLGASVEDSDGVWMVPALTGLGAPFWRPDARGALLGLTRGTRPAHIARAALESIAFRVCDVLKEVERSGGLGVETVRVDGGAARNNLLMQIQADLLGTPLERSHQTEITAMGAALFAGIGAGILPPDASQTWWQRERRFEPGMDTQKRAARYAAWRKVVGHVADWSEQDTK
ncbi:MAG: glycerol kinase GlpK [Gammaproteobacteria bacterium]